MGLPVAQGWHPPHRRRVSGLTYPASISELRLLLDMIRAIRRRMWGTWECDCPDAGWLGVTL